MNKIVAIGLVAISSLLTTAMTLSRKYVLKSMDKYSILVVDSIITGAVLIGVSLYMGGIGKVKKQIQKMDSKTLAAFIGATMCVAISTIIGYELLATQKLSYLAIISTGVGLTATMAASAIFLGEGITKWKLLAAPILLFAVWLAS